MQLSSFLLHIKKKAKNYVYPFQEPKMPKTSKDFFSRRGTRSLGHREGDRLNVGDCSFFVLYKDFFRVRDYFDSSLEVFAGGAVPGKAVLCPGMEYCGRN